MAPPGIGKRPMNAGIEAKLNLLSPINVSRDETITSSFSRCFSTVPSIVMKSTVKYRFMVGILESEVRTTTIPLLCLGQKVYLREKRQ